MPGEKTIEFAKEYGDRNAWRGKHRNQLLNLSELEILLTYNAEERGFLNYYALADNLTQEARKVLWLTTSSFFRTLAGKRQNTLKQVANSLKNGPERNDITLNIEEKPTHKYYFHSS